MYKWVFLFLSLALGLPQAKAASVIYIADNSGNLATVTTGGAVTTIGSMGSVMTDIAVSPGGQLYGVTSGGNLVTINSTTAAVTTIGSLGASINSLAFRSDGVLFGGSSAVTSTLYTINTTTGAASALGVIGFQSAGDLEFVGGTLYLTANTVTGNFAGDSSLVQLNQTTGAGTLIGSTGFNSVNGLAYDDGTLYGFSNNTTNQILVINTATGAGSSATGLSPSVVVNGAATLMPEPSSIVMLAIGFLGMAGYGWHRFRRKSAA